MSEKAIGIFDSGIGGTSIWREINTLSPNENCIYLADSKNAPYGPKGAEAIKNLSIKNTEILIEKGCKLIVVACNTATTNAIQYLREQYNVPFIGIEPAIKPAALHTKTNTIGILATKGTLSSNLFHQSSKAHTQGVEVIETEGEGLVRLIENHNIATVEMQQLLQKYLEPMLSKNIDTLVLGCTHYPYIIPVIKKIVGENVKIIDSGAAVALQTKKILTQNGLTNNSKAKGKNIFYTNSNSNQLKKFLKEEHHKNIQHLSF